MNGMYGKDRVRIVHDETLPDHLQEIEYDIPARFRAIVLKSQVHAITDETRKGIRKTLDTTP